MLKYLVLSISLCFILIKNADLCEGYCWCDCYGIVPFEAYKEAGVDRHGRPIYIGQVLFGGKLIPGKIHHDSNEIHIEFRRAYTLNKAIKILCTDHPEYFKWIRTKNHEALDVGEKYNLFVGGFEDEVATYIGRWWSFDELTVGKVICYYNQGSCIPLTTVEKDSFYLHTEFEILVYDLGIEALRTGIRTPILLGVVIILLLH